MLQETIMRMHDTGSCTVAAPSIICAKNHADIITTQAKDIGVTPLHIILEPMGRNTAPVAAIATEIINNYDPNGLILLLDADHYIEDIAEFWRCVARAANIERLYKHIKSVKMGREHPHSR
ncbi:MAG: hypothetical protein COA43_05825 [Robiginitomaculum sp.]|nr:MAG: hypothetical protein COA43_05825 [Robiginitomaculum sp.]